MIAITKSYNIFLLILFATSCGPTKIQRDYEIPNLKEHIKAFVISKKCFEKNLRVLVVNLEVRSDTLFLEMADTYPNINELKFNCDTVLFENRIIFTGERIKGYYKKSSVNEFPADIIEINQNRALLSNGDINLWEFTFKDGSLVYKSTPCNERK